MSLVAYYDSDDSGSEIDEQSTPKLNETIDRTKSDGLSNPNEIVSANLNPGSSTSDPKLRPTVHVDSERLLFPSSRTTNLNFDLRILDRNRSQPIRITVPSLTELEKDDSQEKKIKLKPSEKGSGLFSLLPEPKNVCSAVSKSLTPQSVRQVKKPPVQKHISSAKSRSKKPEPTEEQDDTEETVNSFFFSNLDDTPLPPPVEIDLESYTKHPDCPSSYLPTNSSALEAQFQSDHGMKEDENADSNPHDGPSQLPDDSVLDQNALAKLCGSRDRRKGPDFTSIIDVNGSSLVGDTSLVLSKELSKEQPTHSFKRKSECSTQQRRKHQITYLAEQAKAQELELRNNWAQNRMTRKQTQAKYGF